MGCLTVYLWRDQREWWYLFFSVTACLRQLWKLKQSLDNLFFFGSLSLSLSLSRCVCVCVCVSILFQQLPWQPKEAPKKPKKPNFKPKIAKFRNEHATRLVKNAPSSAYGKASSASLKSAVQKDVKKPPLPRDSFAPRLNTSKKVQKMRRQSKTSYMDVTAEQKTDIDVTVSLLFVFVASLGCLCFFV